jgi:hypothetical protein
MSIDEIIVLDYDEWRIANQSKMSYDFPVFTVR